MSKSKTCIVSMGALCASLGFAAANAEQAPTQPLATLATLDGTVMVQNGSGYAPADAGMSLAPSDRIFVLEESRATLAFADGCNEEIVGPDMRTLTDDATCKPAQSMQEVAAQAAANADAVSLTQAATSQAAAGLGALGGASAGVIGLGVATVAGAAWALSEGTGSDDRPRRVPPPISPQ